MRYPFDHELVERWINDRRRLHVQTHCPLCHRYFGERYEALYDHIFFDCPANASVGMNRLRLQREIDDETNIDNL